MTRNQLTYHANLETARSNLAKEKETNRSNVAKEKETNRSNLAVEAETKRHNKKQEGIAIANTVVSGVTGIANAGAKVAASLL